MNLDQFRNFVNSSETITIPNPMAFTGAVVFTGTVTISGVTLSSGTAFSADITPSSNDGAGLGTTALKWSDLFLASGAVINFNSGDVTITHSSNALAFAGGTIALPATNVTGDVNFGVDDTGVDVKFFGATASCYALWDQSEDQLVVVQTNAATTGVERSLTVSQTHTGIGASAEALAVTLTTDTIGGTYQNAILGKIDYATTGGLTGLAGVICGELDMPGGTIAGGVGTYSVFEAEINCPTSYDSTVPVTFFDLNAWGAAVGKFDDYGYLFILTGVTSGAAHLWYDNQKAAPAVEEFIRVKTPAGDRFLGLYNANA